MALVRKTEKLKGEILECLNMFLVQQIREIIKQDKLIETMESMVKLGWRNGFIMPPEQCAVFDDLKEAGMAPELVVFAPVQLVFDATQALPNSWDRMVDIRSSTNFYIPILKKPRMVFKHPTDEQNISLRCCLTAKPIYDELVPGVTFKMGVKLPSVNLDKLNSDGTWDIQEINIPKKNTMYGQHEKVTRWHGILGFDARKTWSDNALDSLAHRTVDSDEEMAYLFDRCVEVEARLMKACDSTNKTKRYIFGELWKLPSLNKMYEFFPAIRAFIPAEILERLERGGSKRPQYNIARPDDDILVNATKASIRK